jgi:hypothetical protein
VDVLVKHGLRNSPHVIANCRDAVRRCGGPDSVPHQTDLMKHYVAASLAAAASDSRQAAAAGRPAASASGAAATAAAPAAGGEGGQPQRRCQQCDAVEGRLQKCRGCRQVYYCGRDCQALDWDLHKPLCKRVQREQQAVAQAEAAA